MSITVNQLIQELQKFPQDAVVICDEYQEEKNCGFLKKILYPVTLPSEDGPEYDKKYQESEDEKYLVLGWN
jgi:hypothetical protein